MKHTYSVTGMTCNGCRASVESKLNNIEGVINANVNLETKEAVLETKEIIPIQVLKNALLSKYTITERQVGKLVLREQK